MPGDKTAQEWFQERGDEIFTWRAQWATAMVVLALLALAYFVAGAPFGDPVANAISWLWLPIVGLVTGSGTWTLFAILRFQGRLADEPFLVKMLDGAHRPLYELNRFAHFVTIVVLTGTGLLLATGLREPWPRSPAVAIVLLVFTFYPVVSYVWSVLQIHRVQREIKHQHLDHLAQDMDRLYKEFRESPSVANAERLKHLLTVQESIQRASDWPISLQNATTFALTVAIPAALNWALRDVPAA